MLSNNKYAKPVVKTNDVTAGVYNMQNTMVVVGVASKREKMH